ncbi:MAG: hypothetical protein RL693_2771 [Verrucomicrobiota bacterium]
MRHLDGRTSATDNVRVNELLRQDAEARAMLRSIAIQAATMGDMASTRVLKPSRQASSLSRRPRWQPWLAAAALVSALALIALPLLNQVTSTVLKVSAVNGDIFYHKEMDEPGMLVKIEDRLQPGTLETEDDGSIVTLEFQDGTSITLSGGSELSFVDGPQKRLMLKRGTLTANVKPQPHDRPMLVITPTAEVQVVGTMFTLSARPEDTLVIVDKGLVKVKRLADGQSADLSANNSLVASIDTQKKLKSGVTPVPILDWSFDFTNTAPPAIWRGIWSPAPHDDGNLMISSPYQAKRFTNGTILTHFGVSIRTSYLNPPQKLMASDTSVIRFRLKQDEFWPLQIMLFTNETNGAYGGNYEVRMDLKDLHPDESGWCELELPVSSFWPVDLPRNLKGKNPSPAGKILTGVLISSFQKNTHLSVSHFELQSKPRL